MVSRRPLVLRVYRRARRRQITELARRIQNLLVALVAIVATAPLMLIIAVLVRFDSRGTAIYRQPRVGHDRRRRPGLGWRGCRRRADLGGRIFTILKFRTMREDSEAGQAWAARNDPRVTKVGRFLRASRLDELPQFLNVVKGDMNIVGPRPEQPDIFAELRSELPTYGKRQRVLPGITGLAQVHAGYDESLEDVRRKILLDLAYIDRRSALQDLTIMARTMPVMIRGMRRQPSPVAFGQRERRQDDETG